MINFISGIIVGIALATVGFDGVTQIGNRAIDGIQSFTQSTVK